MNYPFTISNKVEIFENGEKNSIKQSITMLDNSDEKSNILFDFKETKTKDGTSSSKSIAQIINKDGKTHLKLSLADKLESLPENLSEILSNEEGLEINCPPPAIRLENKGSELVVSVSSKDKKPYTITISTSSIKIQTQDESGKNQDFNINLDPKESHIDIDIQRKVVEDLIVGENPLYHDYKIQGNTTKNSIPQSLLYLYLHGMEDNSSLDLGKYNITKCNFNDKDDPFFFIRRENDTLLYTNGTLRKCDRFFFQHDVDKTRTPALVIEGGIGKNRPYYKIPISDDEKFNTAFELMFQKAQLDYEDKRIQKINPQNGPQKISNSTIIDLVGENIYSFNEDLREYSIHNFTYRPKTYTTGLKTELSSSDELTPETETPEDEKPETETPEDEKPEDNDDSEGEAGVIAHNENPPDNTNDFVPAEIIDDNQNNNNNDNNQQDQNKKTPKKSAKEKNSSPIPHKEIDKENVKNVAESVSSSIMGVGIWLGICCMIPGVNVIAAIIALALVVSGALLNTYADKIADFKFRSAEKKVKEYEDEAKDNANFKENFIENEHELEKLHQISNEKISNLENMMSPPENGGNFVANTFAQNYNQNGIGFIHKEDQPENYGIKSLTSMDSLSFRQSIVEDLSAIRNETNSDVRNDLISNFTQTYFTSLEPKQSQKLAEMFLPEHDEELSQFIKALSETNKAQQEEGKLYDSQKKEIEKSNEKRLKYLFSHSDLSREEREHFIDRYGFSILKSYTINDNISTEKIEALIDSLPAEQREFAAAKFYEIANASREKVKDIATIAKEEHEKTIKLDNLIHFKESMLKTSDENYFAFFSQCKENTADFLLKYTHLAYSKSTDKLKNKFSFYNKDKTTLLPPRTNPLEVVVFQKMKTFIEKSTERSELTEELISSQQLKNEFIKKYYAEDIAKLYLENKTSDFYTDGIAPNPATFTFASKAYSQEEIATKFAKQDLIDFISKNFNFDKENKDKIMRKLSKSSLTELVSMIELNEDEVENRKSLTITIGDKKTKVERFPSKDVSKEHIDAFDRAENAFAFGSCCKDYDSVYNENIARVFADLSTLNGTANPIIKVEESGKGKISFNYEITNEIGEKNNVAIPLSSYILKYPQLKTFPLETQKNIIVTMLSAEYKLSTFKRKSIEEKDPLKISPLREEENRIINTYQMALTLSKSILNGQYRDAVYQTTFELGLDGALSDVSYKDVKLAAKNTNQALNGFIHVGQTFDLFGEENARNLLEIFNNLHEASPERDASALVRDSLEKIIGKYELPNGEKYLDIFNRHFTDATFTKSDNKDFEKFIEAQRNTIDKQTQLILDYYISSLGKQFVKREMRHQRNGIIDKTVPTYDNYLELFSEFGLDKSEIAKVLAEADDFEKGIEELIKRAGISDKELEKFKIKKDKIKIGQFDKSTKELYGLYRKQYDIDKAYSEYDTIMDTLLNGSPDKDTLVSLVERLGNIDSKLLKTLGINLKDVTKLIPNGNLTKEDLEKLSALHEKNHKLYIRGSTKLKQDIIKNNEIAHGETNLDKKSIEADTEYRTFKARSSKFKHDFGIICDFISKNPKNSEINKILEAFVNGDNEFFELRDKIGLKDLDDISIAVFEAAGIDLKKISSLAKIKNKSKLIKKLQILNDKMQRKLEQEEKRKEKEAKEIKVKAKKEKDDKAKTNIGIKNHSSFGNALLKLGKLFQRKAIKESKIRIEREEARKEIDRAKIREKEHSEELTEEHAEEHDETHTEEPKEDAEDGTEAGS